MPKSTCNTSFNFASILPCVRGLDLRYQPQCFCSVGVMHRLHPGSDTAVARPESVLDPRESCPSFLVLDPQLLLPSQDIDHTAAHDVRSELEVPLLPSGFFAADDWWLSQRRGLRTSCLRCRCPCLLEPLDLFALIVRP